MNSCVGNCGQGDHACKTPELCRNGADFGPLLGLYLLLASAGVVITLLGVLLGAVARHCS